MYRPVERVIEPVAPYKDETPLMRLNPVENYEWPRNLLASSIDEHQTRMPETTTAEKTWHNFFLVFACFSSFNFLFELVVNFHGEIYSLCNTIPVGWGIDEVFLSFFWDFGRTRCSDTVGSGSLKLAGLHPPILRFQVLLELLPTPQPWCSPSKRQIWWWLRIPQHLLSITWEFLNPHRTPPLRYWSRCFECTCRRLTYLRSICANIKSMRL